VLKLQISKTNNDKSKMNFSFDRFTIVVFLQAPAKFGGAPEADVADTKRKLVVGSEIQLSDGSYVEEILLEEGSVVGWFREDIETGLAEFLKEAL
jgi:hypothetical protein